MNNPDRIIFVGEALVGNEAVDQLTKFDRALRDFSSASGAGKGRGIDGMLITKWDTVDDKVSHSGILVDILLSGSELVQLIIFIVGWSSVVDDLCHWAADFLCWLWPDVH